MSNTPTAVYFEVEPHRMRFSEYFLLYQLRVELIGGRLGQLLDWCWGVGLLGGSMLSSLGCCSSCFHLCFMGRSGLLRQLWELWLKIWLCWRFAFLWVFVSKSSIDGLVEVNHWLLPPERRSNCHLAHCLGWHWGSWWSPTILEYLGCPQQLFLMLA